MADANETSAWIGVIGVSIGAGTSIITQIVGNIVTGKRETKRLAFDETRFQHEAAARSKELVFESKRLAFVDALQLAEKGQRFIRVASSNAGAMLNGKLAKEDQAWLDRWFGEWRTVRAEVRLLDETLAADMTIFESAIHEWTQKLGIDLIQGAVQRFYDVENAVDELRTAMQVSLERY